MQVSQHRNQRTADSASTLDTSEQRLRSLVDSAAVAIVFVDLRGRLTHLNRSFADLLGYQADELLGRSFKDFLHPADRSRMARLFLKTGLLRRQPPMLEFRALHKDGHTLNLMSKPTRTMHDGKTIGFQAILTDVTEKKRAQDTAERYSQFLEAVIENIPEPIVIKSRDSKHLIVNKAHLELTGRTRDETLGKTDYELYPKEQAKILRKEDQKALNKGSTIDLPDTVLNDAKGFKHILHGMKTPLKDAEGKLTHIISIANDITESKKMEESLRESEENYRAIVENSPNFILILQEGVVRFVNEAACKRSGWTFEELTSPSFNYVENVVAKEFQGLAKDNIVKRSRGETIPPFEINLLSREGSEFPVFVRAQRILYRGQPADLVILADITELKKVQEKLAEHSVFLGNVLSSMSDYVYVFDENYTVRFINEAARKKYGFKLGDKCFKTIRNRDSPCHNSGIPCEIHEILEKGKDHFEDTRRDTNGILTHMLARPITLVGRKAIILVSRDITELKRSEEELKRSMSTLQAILESTADGILVVNKDEKIANYNQRYVKMFHIPEPIMKSQDDRELIEFIWKQVKDPEAYYKRTRELFAHPELERLDLLEFKDGRVFERYSRPQQAGREVVGRVISFRDVTERKQIEDEAEKYRQFLETIIDNIPDPIYIKTPDSTHVIVNTAHCNLLGRSKGEIQGGRSKGEIQGRTDYELFSKEQADDFRKADKEVIEKGSIIDIPELRITDVNGFDHILHTKKAPLKDGKGNVTHIIGVTRDITQQHRMQEEIRSLAKFPAENPNPVLRLSSEGVILYSNHAGLAILRDWKCRVGDETPQFWRSIANETYSSQSNRTVDVELGEKVYSFFVAPVKESGYINLYGRDITEQKRGEESLRDSEHFNSSLLANSPNPILVANPDTSIRYVNPALERMTGYSSSEVVGKKPPYPWWPKESIERVTKRLENHMVGGTQHYEERWQKKNGESCWVEINASTIKNNGALSYYLSIWVDITKRKQMEEELRRYSEDLEELVRGRTHELKKSEEKYRLLVDNMATAVFTVDTRGNYTFVNRVTEELTGYSAPRLLSMNMKELIAPEFLSQVQERLQKRIKGERELPPVEFEITKADGKRLPVEMMTTPILNEEQALIGNLGVVRDLTERKRMEEVKNHLMSVITHELRSPLTSLNGYLELVMKESRPLPTQLQSDLEVMKRNTDRLLNLTNDLLDIQRLKVGKLQLNMEKMDLRKVIDEAVDEISPLVQARKQSLIVEHLQQRLPIHGDQMRLGQVLMNLLSNAEKFTNEGGKIIICTRAGDDLITVAVSDTGIGIKKEDLNSVFDPFAVIQKPSYIKGTGLGLSVSKDLIEVHGGKIWAESAGEGKGATFTFTLPKREV